ncbi:ADP-forming succinate--CoA ligase subunit beta [Dongshaea marina]|uniref:ADP-forming succinate--CoA ligase subunit beta n=1 Tax=Dongshaea marina TaxID=2047966 RepID=UPI000D3E9AA3|nr:ADP-forming succinate--CoA ligase subunit beta [Dongshaea marina]
MNLHEYQAKRLLLEYDMPVPEGYVVGKALEAVQACERIGGQQWVAKCQIHAGGRGKAGGVKLCHSRAEIKEFSDHWLGREMKTYQTGDEGKPVNHILIEACTESVQELYLGVVVDRSLQRMAVIASSEGGVEIETVASTNPAKIHTVAIDPLVGPQPYQARELAFKLGLVEKKLLKQFTKLFLGIVKMYKELDLAMLEINPLVITKEGKLCCLDAKVSVDANAIYRQPRLHDLRDRSQEDDREYQASKWELNYVALQGNIGCMVNGAGLAMGTMDIIKFHGGEPANFLDVGGGATRERVVEAFKIILSDSNVSAILVNIFGGIVRCDLIAAGIIGAVQDVGVSVPVVVRLEGNHAEEGAAALSSSGLDLITASSLSDAAIKVVEAAGRSA